MENGGSNNQEIDNSSKRRRGQSARFNFFAFLLIFGWEGPLGLYMGLQEGNIGLIIAGLFITAFLWGLFGIEELKDFIKEMGHK